MKYYLLYILFIITLFSCKKEGKIRIEDSSITIDSVVNFEKPDSNWFKKNLLAANEELYMLDSIGEFKLKFDSIQNHYNWNITLGKGTPSKKDSYNIHTYNLTIDPGKFNQYIKIIARLDSKNNRVIKLLVFAEGIGDDFDNDLLKVIKGTILSTKNSNHDANDADLILHQVGVLNRLNYSVPGVLTKDGSRYESHDYNNMFYFGMAHH